MMENQEETIMDKKLKSRMEGALVGRFIGCLFGVAFALFYKLLYSLKCISSPQISSEAVQFQSKMRCFVDSIDIK